MGNLWSSLPNFNIFNSSNIKSSCCNKIEDISISYTKCCNCKGSGKIYIKSLEYNNIDVKKSTKEIFALTEEKG